MTVPPSDRPLFGIALMLGFCMTAPIGDGLAKELGAVFPILHLVVWRFLIQAAVLAPWVMFAKGGVGLNRRITLLIAVRSALHIVGLGAMFLALRYLPLADAVAIAFVMPFILLLLGRGFLNEDVGWRRLVACAVGFLGTLLIMQPSFAAVGWPAALPVLVAFVFAFFMLITRALAKTVDPIALQAVSGGMALLILIPGVALLALLDRGGPVFVCPTPGEWGLLFALGFAGTVAHLLMTWSLRFAPSATLAPIQYMEIPFAVLIGWAFFRELPNGRALWGIAIVISAGLYILFRERAIAGHRPTQ